MKNFVMFVSQSYVDQKLDNGDTCTITDPIYKAQRTALISLYSQQGSNGNRSIGDEKDLYSSIASKEHGIATDIAASYLSEREKAALPIFARWKYDPLNFRISESKDNKIEVAIFPNPTSNMLNIYINNISEDDKFDLIIKSIEGKIVLDKKSINMPANQINTSELTNGIYFIEIKSYDKVIYSDKFIKID